MSFSRKDIKDDQERTRKRTDDQMTSRSFNAGQQNYQRQPKLIVVKPPSVSTKRLSLHVVPTGKEKGRSKKIRDADGWELVRGRNRFRESPSKKIISDLDPLTTFITVKSPKIRSESSHTCGTRDNVKLFETWPDPSHSEKEPVKTPGKAFQMFSSPSRKRSLSETIRRHEEKLAKAQEAREKYLEEKAQKFKDIARKVEDMKAWKEEQQQQIRISMMVKLQRAEENRRQQIEKIVKKAHDEESKVNEIQFINTLEAENKRHDFLSKEKGHEDRLLNLQEERQRKLEEKAAKEIAAEERRKALEVERQAKVEAIQQKRKLKDKKIQLLLQEKEKERQELASQKAREREQKLSAINAAHLANVEELQKKIHHKLEEGRRRHTKNMEQVRQKAFELSVRRCTGTCEGAPGAVPYETQKICSLCKVLIGSEVNLYNHLRGKKHQDTIRENLQDPSNEELQLYNLKHIIDATSAIKPDDPNTDTVQLDKEKLKAIKKRCKKIKQRMVVNGTTFEKEWKQNVPSKVMSQNKVKISKILKELNALDTDTKVSGPWSPNMLHSLDRNISELHRIIKNSYKDQLIFNYIDGLNILNALLNRALCETKCKGKDTQLLSTKSIINICSLLETLCSSSIEQCDYIFNTNMITCLLDCSTHRLDVSTTVNLII